MIYTHVMVQIAKLFQNGRSQAVRLPKEFRFPGDKVRIRKTRNGVLLQTINVDTKAWFEKLDRFNAEEQFMPEGREQPIPPERESFK
jgi:antitoxin VapB